MGPCLVVIRRSAFLRKWIDGAFACRRAVRCLHRLTRCALICAASSWRSTKTGKIALPVLRSARAAFLPTCREDELREFFGQWTDGLPETGDGSAFTIFTLETRRWRSAK